MTPLLRVLSIFLAGIFLAGCAGVQSSLDARSDEAARIAQLFWIMTGASLLIVLAVGILFGFAVFGSAAQRKRLASERLILIGGIAFPMVTLTALLIYGFILTEPRDRADEQSLRIAVVGEQWWWRVRYRLPDGRVIESANEIRLPVGRRVVLELTSADVIHSLWIPNLAGKLDMIPGRTNRLVVSANQTAVMRAQCAEFCGGAHAMMALFVVALEPQEFERWLASEASPAIEPAVAVSDGVRLFRDGGCGACHAVRGTDARGAIGPDLTHLGSRRSLAAGALPNDAVSIARWIRDNQHIKPENKMPAYHIYTDAELQALATYLAGLK